MSSISGGSMKSMVGSSGHVKRSRPGRAKSSRVPDLAAALVRNTKSTP
jgi:hypothetical protein